MFILQMENYRVIKLFKNVMCNLVLWNPLSSNLINIWNFSFSQNVLLVTGNVFLARWQNFELEKDNLNEQTFHR